MAARKRDQKQDYHCPREWFLTMGMMKSREFDQILMDNPTIVPIDEGYPVFRMIEVLIKLYRKEQGRETHDDDMRQASLNTKLIKERVLKEAINNRRAAGLLVSKAEAESRIRRTLAATVLGILLAMQQSAEAMAEEFGGDIREHVELQNKHYRKVFKTVKDGALDTNWLDFSDAESLQRRLKDMANIDAEYADLVEDIT